MENNEELNMDCIFCNYEGTKVINHQYWFAIFDGYPVSEGHMLIIPQRHVNLIDDLYPEEKESFFEILHDVQRVLNEIYKPDGFNIGVNIGKAAGQTVEHLHIHVIPRYTGDMNNPDGGVRGVIPEKQKYEK